MVFFIVDNQPSLAFTGPQNTEPDIYLVDEILPKCNIDLTKTRIQLIWSCHQIRTMYSVVATHTQTNKQRERLRYSQLYLSNATFESCTKLS